MLVAYYIRDSIRIKFRPGELFVNQTYPTITLVVCLLAVISIGIACNQGENTAVDKTAPSPSQSTTPSNVAAPPAADATEIAGDYTISGTNEGGGGQYGGELKVTKRDEVYQFSWSSGGRAYDGVGVRTDNNVAVSFTEGSDGKGCGVVLYKIGSDSSLDGKAGYWGVNQAETEKATRTSGTDLEGNYDVAGSNPGGDEYEGKLAVKKDGLGYAFAWDTGSASNGFGIRTGDKVTVGIGGAQCGFVSYEIRPDGSLDGKWGGQGLKSIGTEIAKRK